MKKVGCILFSMLVIGINAKAQQWERNIQEKPNTYNNTETLNFFSKQKAFKEYWQGKEVEKGKGYKQFKRWEYFMDPRVNENGFIDNIAYWDALQQKKNNQLADTFTWNHIGPSATPFTIGTTNINGNGRLNCIEFHPSNENILYVGSPSGGFWKTTNGGSSWETTTDDLGSLGVSDIAVNPQNPDEIYIVTGDGDAGDTYGIGILKSEDGGETWDTTSLSLKQSNFIYFRRILMYPGTPDTMIATSNAGILRTTDGWDSYQNVSAGSYVDIEFQSGNPQVVIASSYSSAGNAGIYKSTNGGETFAVSMTGLNLNGEVNRIELAVTADNINKIYALASDADNDGFHGLYESDNMGDSWSAAYTGPLNLLGWSANGQDNGGQGWYDLALAVSPTNENEVYVGGINIWKTSNGGISWDLNTHWTYSTPKQYVHADQHMLAYSPLNSSKLYSANDGGLYVTQDGGINWTSISNGLEITQFYKLGTAVSSEKIISGSQDNGTMFYNGTNEWVEVFGGDGMECIISYVDENILYAEIYNGAIFKSYNQGLSFVSISPSGDPQGAWVTPYVIHPTNPDILIAGYKDLYRTKNAGDSWTKITSNLQRVEPENDSTLRNVIFAPYHPDYIYISSRENIWRSSNSGVSWENINSNLPSNVRISSIAVSDKDPNRVWISLSGFNSENKVFQTMNGGGTWSNISEGLPNAPTTSIVYRRNSFDELYIGTDIGVYKRDGSMSSWTDISSALPNSPIGELEINYNTSRLYAATYGRGVWYTQLGSTVKSTASFGCNTPLACINAEVKLFVEEETVKDSLSWFVEDGEIVQINGDTVVVTWNNLGKKDVGLTIYNSGDSVYESRVEFVNVANTIDFIITPSSSVSKCNTQPVELKATGGYDFSWSPSTGLNKTFGETVITSHDERIVYSVTGTHGTCSLTKEVTLYAAQDDICNAKFVSIGHQGIYSNTCATPEANEPVPPQNMSCNQSNDYCCKNQITWCQGELVIHNSIWFKTIVPSSGNLSVSTIGMDTQIALYKAASCSALKSGSYTFLAANDDYPGRADYSSTVEQISGLTPGDSVWIQIDGSFGGVSGSFYVYVDEDYDPSIGVKEYLPMVSSRIFPNPNKGTFNVDVKMSEPSQVKIEVYSISGQLLRTEFSEEKSLRTNIEFNVQSKGIHFVVISTENRRITKKIIIE